MLIIAKRGIQNEKKNKCGKFPLLYSSLSTKFTNNCLKLFVNLVNREEVEALLVPVVVVWLLIMLLVLLLLAVVAVVLEVVFVLLLLLNNQQQQQQQYKPPYHFILIDRADDISFSSS